MLFLSTVACILLKPGIYYINTTGEMVEWSKAPHWKCGDGQLSEGSNPSLSAIFFCKKMAERRRKSSLHCAKHNFTQKAQPFLHIFTKNEKPCLRSRSLWSLVKTFRLRSTCEVAAYRRVDVFLFTALRLHGGKPPCIFLLR